MVCPYRGGNVLVMIQRYKIDVQDFEGCRQRLNRKMPVFLSLSLGINSVFLKTKHYIDRHKNVIRNSCIAGLYYVK